MVEMIRIRNVFIKMEMRGVIQHINLVRILPFHCA